MTEQAAVTRLRKEIGGAEPGTLFADVIEVCNLLNVETVRADSWIAKNARTEAERDLYKAALMRIANGPKNWAYDVARAALTEGELA